MEVQIPERTHAGLRLALVALVAALAPAGCGRSPDAEQPPRAGERVSAQAGEVVLTPATAREGRRRTGAQRESAPADRAEDGAPEYDPRDDAPSPGAPSDSQVRAELRQARAALNSFRAHLTTSAFLRTGPRARVLPDGTAVAPANAPEVVQRVILAGSEIAKFPYKWGGGHGAWRDDGYDCSGSVSFALAGAGLIGSPLTSGGFLRYGEAGAGRWITIYTHQGHIFMVVAGLRFDTSGQGRASTRWQEEPRSTAGFTARHIPGL